MGTGWESDKRAHFDEIVLNYDRVRPDYPDKLFADVFEYAGGTKVKKALEIGAGTGKATRPFIEAGYAVTAVEIGANMADFMRERYKQYESLKVIVSAFEDASLEEDSFDLVYAATSFHWVDAKIGCPKVFRLLRSGGAVALFRYNIFPGEGEERNQEIQKIYAKHYYSHYGLNNKPVKKTHKEHRQPDEILYRFGFSDLGAYGFRDVTMELYDVEQTFSAKEYIGFLETLSDHRHLPEDDRADLYTGIEDVINRYGGRHKVDYVFQLYMGRKP